MPVTIGQKLWLVPIRGFGQPHEVTVGRLGRKWAYIGEGRSEQAFDPDSGYLDGKGYSSPGRLYRSQEHYEDMVAAEKAWQRLVSELRYMSPPANVGISQICEARKLLGIAPADTPQSELK